jgi:hypothetical protein
MSAKGTDSGSSASTTKTFGTKSSYSIDFLKKAAFVDELNCVLLVHHNTVDMKPVIQYLEQRIDEITKAYK